MTDHFDLVRSLYDAINRRDLEAIAESYDERCSAEHLFGRREVLEGRAAVRDAYARELREWDGALDGGARVRVRTIGGIETGWGWVLAEWSEGVRRLGGEVRRRTGHSHFLVERDLIQRQRCVVTAEGDQAAVDQTPRAASETRRYPTRPIVGVGAVIFVDGRVVLVRRRHEPLAGHWSLPGGTLELGETLESGVAREVLEETGLAVEVGPVVDVFDRILLDAPGQVRYHFVLVDYLCRPIGGRLGHGSDVDDVTLVASDALEQYRLTGKATDVIRRAVGVAREIGWPFITAF